MPDTLVLTLDKFKFTVPTDRFYTDEGLWILPEGDTGVRIGLSDFVQQRSGDVAFAEVPPPGTSLDVGDEVAVIETIKVDVYFESPVAGEVAEVNPALDMTPEAINQDPYGEGWLALIQPSDWGSDRERLLDAGAYLEKMRADAEEEAAAL